MFNREITTRLIISLLFPRNNQQNKEQSNDKMNKFIILNVMIQFGLGNTLEMINWVQEKLWRNADQETIVLIGQDYRKCHID